MKICYNLNMEWTKYTIKTTIEAEDIVSAMLMELGVEGIEIEDALPPTDSEFKAMFIDPEPELLPDDEATLEEGASFVSFYLRMEGSSSDEAGAVSSAEAVDATAASAGIATVDDSYTIHDREWSRNEVRELLQRIGEGLEAMRAYANIGEGTIHTELSREDDWRNNWKEFFKAQVMGDIIVKPTWAEVPEELQDAVDSGEMKIVEMDPGTAFGTGGHETTKLCVDGLEKYLGSGDKVLDIGTGSGILGFCALAKGASFVMATELDPDCEHIILDNLKLNNVSSELFEIAIGNIVDDEVIIERAAAHAPYDIIVSNILAPVIATLAGEGRADFFAEKGTIFITSGIINTREEEVLSAFRGNSNWEIMESVHLGEWVSVVARHK